MFDENRKNFLKWYVETKNSENIFDFQTEITKYFKMDVCILRRVCLKFRELILSVGNTDPFLECMTIASTCMRVFRKNFLRKQTIGILPSRGYRLVNNQSKKAIEWIIWEQNVRNKEIIHSYNNREFRIPEGITVDGYYEDNDSKFVLQFHGYFWHGCP